MSSIRVLPLLALSLMVAPAPLVAQETNSPSSAKVERTSAAGDERHIDMSLLAASREQCDIATRALDEVQALVRKARNAENPTISKSALEELTPSLLSLQTHLGTCSDTMKMLEYRPAHAELETRAQPWALLALEH
jgi:hypothetical protein